MAGDNEETRAYQKLRQEKEAYKVISIVLFIGLIVNVYYLANSVPKETYLQLQNKYGNLTEQKTIYFEKGCNCSLELEQNCNLTATCNVEESSEACKANIILTGTLEDITPKK
jgi:hypothetical protein